jgi:hypothetical protein
LLQLFGDRRLGLTVTDIHISFSLQKAYVVHSPLYMEHFTNKVNS